MIIKHESMWKRLRSEGYQFDLHRITGRFFRWGRTLEEDPQWSPFGPEILDLEISSGGGCLGNCSFCYKCNGGDQPTYNMTFTEFQTIFDKMPPVLNQIAFGIMNIGTNPDFFEMMRYASDHRVRPNYTCHGLDVTDEAARLSAESCGAVAVSIVDKESTYNAVKKFTDAGVQQVTLHFMFSEETYDNAFEIIDDIVKDPRLKKLFCIVFLLYKSKGRNPYSYTSVRDISKYQRIMKYCTDRNIAFGFDSCSANAFTQALDIYGGVKASMASMACEPCESGLFSSYINCHGNFFVCSFAEGQDEWVDGIDVLGCKDFLKDVWFHPRLLEWRRKLILKQRECPIYNLSTIGV